MAQRLTGYEVVLGVTGGVAAYKAADLCSRLVKARAGVTVVLTDNGERFVGKVTFQSLTGRKAYSDLWESASHFEPRHIGLTDRADLVVVAPATANCLAKLAGGICDDLLSTLLLGVDSPVLLAPAMNTRMWTHPATQANVELLRSRGVHLVGPESGRLACGTEGVGRMSEPEVILEAIEGLLCDHPPKRRMANG